MQFWTFDWLNALCEFCRSLWTIIKKSYIRNRVQSTKCIVYRQVKANLSIWLDKSSLWFRVKSHTILKKVNKIYIYSNITFISIMYLYTNTWMCDSWYWYLIGWFRLFIFVHHMICQTTLTDFHWSTQIDQLDYKIRCNVKITRFLKNRK